MECLAIKQDGRYCRNYCLSNNPHFCKQHVNLSREELTRRWKNRYLVAGGGSRMLHPRHRQKVQKALELLQEGVVTIHLDDLKALHNDERYIDIYVILCDYLHCDYTVNLELYLATTLILLRTIEFANPNYLFGLLVDRLILRSSKVLERFLYIVAILAKHDNSMPTRPQFHQFMMSLLETDVAKEFSWNYDGQVVYLQELHKIEVSRIYKDFIEQRWLPDLKELYKSEKQIQKAKMSHCKEELMMICWHPDRVAHWLETGGWPLFDMMSGE
jgi:hypothetical protein